MTPAMSAASRCLALACWRMMSSWRSGRVTSRTAFSPRGRSSSAPTPATRRTPARSASRRRRRTFALTLDLRSPSRLALCRRSRESSGCRQHPDHGRQVALGFLDRPVVDYGVVGAGRLLVLGQLARHPLVCRLMAPALRAARADLLVGDHRDGGVEGALHAGLEQQRYLDHQGHRRRVAVELFHPPRRDALPHARPEQPLEPGAVLRRRKRPRGQRGPVDLAVARHCGPEPLDHRVAHLVGRIEVVHDGVGGQRGGAQPLEDLQRGRFPGSHAARQADEGDRRHSRGDSAVSGSAGGSAKTSSLRPSSGTSSSDVGSAWPSASGCSCTGAGASPSRATGRIWPSTRLADSDRRRRSESISSTLTRISSSGLTISLGFSTWWAASSEMCTSPSTPSMISTKAPKVTTLVTLPSSSSPTL